MAFFLRRPIRTCLALLCFVYVAAAFLTLRSGDRALYPARDAAVPVYVLNNGFHTDIALPAAVVRARGGILAEAASGQAGDWLVYGWGDAGFYTAKGFSFARALDGLRALFHPGNSSVIRVYGLSVSPDKAFAEQIASPATLSQDGFEAMVRHMEASFVLKNGAPVQADVAADDDFYQSREHFSILRVCNNWTSDQLAAAGLPTAPLIDGNALLLGLDLHWRAGVRKAG